MTAIRRLQEGIDRHAHVSPQDTSVEGLTLFRQAQPRPGVATMYRPSLCVVAGGCKQVVLGDRIFDLAEGHFLIVTVEVPVTGCVVAATPDEPYLGLTVDLDPSRIADLLLSLAPAPAVKQPSAKDAVAIAAGILDDAQIDALARLVALLDEPPAAPVLAPLIERELHYRLLCGEHGRLLRQIATADSHLSQISAAADWIREHHAEPMRIEETRPAQRHERHLVPPPLQGGHDAHTPRVPGAYPPPGGPTPHARRGPRRHRDQPGRGLRKPLAVQPRIPPSLRRRARSRRRATAPGGQRPRWPMSLREREGLCLHEQ